MWEFIKSATDQSNWLTGHGQEVCFIGRSNVGKSSLINALTKGKIARTSNTPGRTQLINFFKEGKKILVDLPGYGYAKMSKTSQRKMILMIEQYLLDRKELKTVFVLVDSRIGPTEDDLNIISFLKEIDRNFMVILTKIDKPTQSQKHKTILKIKEITDDYVAVSSTKKINIDKLLKIVNKNF